MSVLRCNRRNCSNIMCDRFSPMHGYICEECFNELVETGPTTNIKNFMDSEKIDNYKTIKAEAKARYNITFPKGEQ